jgi:hypothetical protein
MPSLIMLSIAFFCYAERDYAGCPYAECRAECQAECPSAKCPYAKCPYAEYPYAECPFMLNIIMLKLFMLKVVMLNVVILNIVILNIIILTIVIVIDTPRSGLKGFSQTLNKLLRCATTPRCATASTWQRPLASL